MFPGRTLDQKRKLVALVTDAVVESVGVDPQIVRVHIRETEKHHSAIGGRLSSDIEGE
jgi:4-oxalocrotonate tautomerase